MKRNKDFIDITGKRFGKLVTIKFVERKGRNYRWLFKCDCGKEKMIYKNHILGKRTQIDCGCDKQFKRRQPLFGTKFYHTFYLMKQRCENINNPNYFRYGGRGIEVVWKSFTSFKEDMYRSFLKHNNKHGGRNTSIERIDNDGNYCKENCKWATQKEQSLNKHSKSYYKNLHNIKK